MIFRVSKTNQWPTEGTTASVANRTKSKPSHTQNQVLRGEHESLLPRTVTQNQAIFAAKVLSTRLPSDPRAQFNRRCRKPSANPPSDALIRGRRLRQALTKACSSFAAPCTALWIAFTTSTNVLGRSATPPDPAAFYVSEGVEAIELHIECSLTKPTTGIARI